MNLEWPADLEKAEMTGNETNLVQVYLQTLGSPLTAGRTGCGHVFATYQIQLTEQPTAYGSLICWPYSERISASASAKPVGLAQMLGDFFK